MSSGDRKDFEQHQRLSFVDKLLMPKTVCVVLVQGESKSGSPVYAYVGVRADKLETFMRAQSKGLFFPEEYGVVIRSGPGRPSSEVREEMERDYSFDHTNMQDIMVETASMQAAALSREASARARLRDASGDDDVSSVTDVPPKCD